MANEYKNKFSPLLSKGIQKVSKDLIISTTYDELVLLRDSGELLVGHYYKFDYQTKHVLGETEQLATGGILNTTDNIIPVEELMLLAISNSLLSKEAISVQYPDHYILYDIDNNKVEVLKPEYSITDNKGTDNYEILWDSLVNITNWDKNTIPILYMNVFKDSFINIFVFSVYASDSDRTTDINLIGRFSTTTVFNGDANAELGYTLGGYFTVAQSWNIATGDLYNANYINQDAHNNRPGFIVRRIDLLRNIDLPIDFIGSRVRRWKIDTSNTFIPGNSYGRGILIKESGVLYMVTDSANISSATDFFDARNKKLLVEYINGYVCASSSPYVINVSFASSTGIIIDQNDFMDFPIIHDSSGNNVYTDSYNIKIESYDKYYPFNFDFLNYNASNTNRNITIKNAIRFGTLMYCSDSNIITFELSFFVDLRRSSIIKSNKDYIRSSSVNILNSYRTFCYANNFAVFENLSNAYLDNNQELFIVAMTNCGICRTYSSKVLKLNSGTYWLGNISINNIEYKNKKFLNINLFTFIDTALLYSDVTKEVINNRNGDTLLTYLDGSNNKQIIQL